MAYPEFTPEELAIEEWRDIPGFRFELGNKTVVYQVSTLGRARSFYVQILKPTPRSAWSNYNTISLYHQVDKTFCRKSIHVAVAEAFHGPRPKGNLVNHKDGVKTNNRVKNLEYCTSRENSLHAVELGLAARGEQRSNAKLTDAQVAQILDLLVQGQSARNIAKKFPISARVIDLIRKNIAWRHVPRPESPRLRRLPYKGNTLGEDAWYAKLTEARVRVIRVLYKTGQFELQEIADAFGISKSQTWRIVKRLSWKHVA